MYFLNLLGSFVIMIVIVCAAYFATRYFAIKANRMTQGKYINMVDRIFLGRDKSILIVKIGNKYFLMSENSQGMTRIADLTEDDLIALETQKPNNTFNDLLNKYLGIQMPDKKGLEKISNTELSSNLKALKERMTQSFEKMTNKNRENVHNDDKEQH